MPNWTTRLERVVTGLVVVLTAITLLLFGTVAAMKGAAADLHLQVAIANHETDAAARSPIDQQLSALLAADLVGSSPLARDRRAQDLDNRSDRLVETAAVVALLGMLVALLAMPSRAQLGGTKTRMPPGERPVVHNQ